MEKILSLTKRLSIQKVTRLRILGNPPPTNEPQESRAHLVYQAILDGEVVDDKSCAAFLGWDVNNRYYVRFKREFYFKLIDMYLFVDAKSINLSIGLLYGATILNKICVIYYLYELGEKKIAVEKAINLLKDINKDKVVIFEWYLSKLIKDYFLYEDPNKKKFRKYKEIYRVNRKVDIAKKYSLYLSTIQNNSLAGGNLLNRNDEQLYKEMYNELIQKFSDIPFKNHYWRDYYKMELILLSRIYTKDKLIIYAKERYLEICKIKQKTIITAKLLILETLFYCYLEKNETEEASYYLNELRRDAKSIKSIIRMLFLEMHFNLMSKRYDQCLIIFNRYNRVDNISKEYYFEHIELIKAWLHLFYLKKKFINISETQYIDKFNIYRFKNNLVANSKDKKGVNAQILIIECCYFLLSNKNELLFNKSGALSKYALRYFANTSSRTGVMLKIMALISKNIFQLDKIKDKIILLKEDLEKYRSKHIEIMFLFEKIPYEEVIEEFIMPTFK